MSSFRQFVARRLAASHLAGPGLEDALRMAGVFSRSGFGFAFGPWVAPDSPGSENFSLYSRAVREIIDNGLNAYLSIKLSSISYDHGRLRALAELGKPAGVRIHCDSIGPDSVRDTMSVLERVARDFPNLGSTLPSRWRRSHDDALTLAGWGVAVRLVKGQWPDPDRPVSDPGREFVGLAEKLAGKAVMVGIATHDRKVARGALRVLRGAAQACEVEQISGLPFTCVPVATQTGTPVRVYIPFGVPFLPYNIWHVKTRPAVALWAIRDFIAGKHRSV